MKHQICRNCGYNVEGPFCANCGQKADVDRLTWRSLIDSFSSTFLGDGAGGEHDSNHRYGIVGTLKCLIINPARTISEYLAGCRRKYFNPVTILLLLSGFFALLSSLIITPEAREQILSNLPKEDWFIDGFRMLVEYLSIHPAGWLLMLLPFKALACKLIFRKYSDMIYVEYLYMGIFMAIFSIIMLIIKIPLDELNFNYSLPVYILMQTVFAIIIIKNLFGLKWKKAIFKFILITLLTYIFALIAYIALFLAIFAISYYMSPEFYNSLKDIEDNDLLNDKADSIARIINPDSLRIKP